MMIEFGAEFWVAVAFLLLLGVFVYKKVPGLITGMLDEKAALIKKQLEEARSLRLEAEALLAQSKKAQEDAIRQVQEISALAAEEAEIQARETRANLTATIERRSRLVQEKITQAEAQAVKEVRDVVINVATEAASELIAEALKSAQKTAIVNDAIQNLDNKAESLPLN